jgi:hypothetical protein
MSLIDLTLDRAARARLARQLGITVLVSGLFAACEGDRPTGLRSPSAQPSAAKGAPQGGGGSGTLTVTAATPPQATQDTSLDVSVTGTGFTTGAKAVWSLNGDTTLVHVKSTKRVSDTQLVASIVIPANAPTVSYDIQVMLVGGKKGVGAELFTVTLKDPTAQFWFPLNDAALGLQSDHLSAYVQGGVSVYGDGLCGVHARIFSTAAGSNSGDATMQTDNNRFADRHCRDYPRKLGIILRDDGGNVVTQLSSTVFMNVHDVENTTDQIAVGSTALRGLTLGEDPHCNGLRWTLVMPDQTTPSGANQVNVTRTSANNWHVQTQPYPNDKAYCLGDGRLYHVPVDFTVVADRPLP